MSSYSIDSIFQKVLDQAIQYGLVTTLPDSPTITVDNLEVAQFINLLLDNQVMLNVIDNITSKAVLVLGRFTEKRKPVLDAMRQALCERNYLPIFLMVTSPRSIRPVTAAKR
jgi:hypothetical protein